MDVNDCSEIFQFDGFRFDRNRGGLFRADKSGLYTAVMLGSRALDVLSALLEQHGNIIAREKIMKSAWHGSVVEENNLTVQISLLRRVLDDERESGSCIQTIPGRGYRFVARVIRVSDVAFDQDSSTIRTGARSMALLDPSVVVAPRLSFVVLPFINLSGNRDEDYLVDAITEDVTSDLARLPGAVVIAYQSSAAIKDKPVDVRRVGKDFGVRYTVAGNLRRFGSRFRVSVQLILAETRTQICDRFDQSVEDLDLAQEMIVGRLRTMLSSHALNAENIRNMQERPNNPDAFDLIVRAWSVWCNPPGPEFLDRSAAMFEQALRLDPSSVPAKCGLADVLINLYMAPGSPAWANENLTERAAEVIADVAGVDPDNERALFCQGYLLRAQGRWAEAIAVLQRVIELTPNDYAAYRQLGFCRIAQGQPEDALPALERAIRLDPLSLSNRFVYLFIGYALLLLKSDEDSVPWFKRALAGGPMSPPPWRVRCYLYIASAQALAGHPDDARQAMAEANRLWPFATVRSLPPAVTGPRGLPDAALVTLWHRVQDGLRLAGLRDHADEDADFGVVPGHALQTNLVGYTPMTVLGAATIRTDDLQDLLGRRRPILIDTALNSWGWSLPGAIGLQGSGHGISLSKLLDHRFRVKIRELTDGDTSVPIVVFCANSERFSGYNLALRLVALGYTQVHWYRGGLEAWTVNGLPEVELVVHDW